MRCLIFGASAGLGRCVAERLTARGDEVILVASDQRDLDALAHDLRLRHGVASTPMAVDLRTLDPVDFKRRLCDGPGRPDAILLVAGFGHSADTGDLDTAIVDDLIDVNFRSGITLLTAFMPEMMAGQISAVVGIGSVAAIRGRRANMVYGAAKRGLEFYFEALRHRLASTDCAVRFYRIGFMKTAMLTRSSGLIPAVSPDWIADRIVGNLHRGGGLSYLPGWWRAIALVLRFLPWAVFRRLDI